MKKFLTRENIWTTLVSLTLGSFAFSERLSSTGIILLIVFFIADLNLINKIKQPKFDKKLIPLIGFFLLYLVFYIFSEKTNSSAHTTFIKSSFLILPLLFYYESYFNRKNERIILLIFTIALSIGFAYELYGSFNKYYILVANPSWGNVFNRMSLSEFIMHPGYSSNFFMFGIIWHYFKDEKYRIPIILFFSAVLLLLISRIVLLFYLVFILFVGLRYIKNSGKPLLAALKVFAIGSIICLTVYQIPAVHSRINSTFSNINDTSKSVKISRATASRRIAYSEEIALIAKSPILGYGIGNANATLKKSLISSGYNDLAEKMHTHNQYFKTWLQTGIAGIAWLMCILAFLLIYFRKNKMDIAFWFTILVAMNLMTDDMLEIQAGIVFFVLVWSLYLTRKEITTK